jgi:thiamine pyrophosphokinase
MITDQTPIPTDGDLIGIDYGAYFLASRQRRMVYAVGDFDSVEPQHLTTIREWSDYVVTLSPDKDETDSEYALSIAFTNDYDDVVILGAFGGRIDHFYANLLLLRRFPHKRIALEDGQNSIRVYQKGTHLIHKSGYKYASLYGIESSLVSLIGFRFPLDHTVIEPTDTFGTSNEILGSVAHLVVHFGEVYLIESNDRQR